MVVKNLRNSRIVLGLTQKDVAEKLNVNNSTVSGWETGKDTIPLKRLVEYANIYHYTLDYLFGIDEKAVKIMDIALDIELLATNLKTLREKNNITQKVVAKKINTSQSTYSSYESAHNLITTSFLYNLTEVYEHLSIDYILTKKIDN